MNDPESLGATEHQALEQVLEAPNDAGVIYPLIRGFRKMARYREGEHFDE